MNTRRFPRTLQEAFGPYTSTKITEPADPPIPLHEKVLYAVCVVAVVVLIVVI